MVYTEQLPAKSAKKRVGNPGVGDEGLYQAHDFDTTSSEDMGQISNTPHPRDGLPAWKWKMMLLANGFLALINGYDVSNVANIQAAIYRQYGHIELLPWVGLGYSVCNIAVIPLARKLTKFYDFKIICIASLSFIIAGSALAGAAPNMQSVIAGRAIMAIGGALIYQCCLSFNVVFAYPHEQGLAQALLGAMFALGLIGGPLIGGAFAENEHATWRWAFFITLPLCGIVLILLLIGLPSYRVPTSKPAATHLLEIDWLGAFLHSATFLLFASGCIFSSSGSASTSYPWSSPFSIAIWTLWPLFLILYILQQTFSLTTTPGNRILPIHLLSRRVVAVTFLCTICAALSYGVSLYYTPLYFAFVHGDSPFQAAVRLLPFIGPFIFTIFLSGGLLPKFRVYMPWYVAGATLLLVGAVLMHTITQTTPQSAVMGYLALIGAGLGLVFNLSPPICSVVLEKPEDRLDQACLHNMAQLGGTAIALSVAGAVYQNKGFDLVKEAIPEAARQFILSSSSDDDGDSTIRTLLGGVESDLFDSGSLPLDLVAQTRDAVVGAVVDAITQCFWILIAAGAVSLFGACCLRWEALDFPKPGGGAGNGATRTVEDVGDAEKGQATNTTSGSGRSSETTAGGGGGRSRGEVEASRTVVIGAGGGGGDQAARA